MKIDTDRKKIILFIMFTLLLSCNSRFKNSSTESKLTAEDFYQLFDWFHSGLLIYTDDSLDPEVKKFIDFHIVPQWENNAYIYLWGADVKTNKPYEIGLELANKIIIADNNYQYEKVPYDDSFHDDYNYYNIPKDGLFCKSEESGCINSQINKIKQRKQVVQEYSHLMDRYLEFLEFEYMETFSLMYMASPIPNYRLLTAGQRIFHLSLLEDLEKNKDIIPKLLDEIKLIRIRLTQGSTLIDKMIMHALLSDCIDLLNQLIQQDLVNIHHSKLSKGISKLTKSELSTTHHMKIEHLSGMRMFNEFLRDAELMVSNKQRNPLVMPLLRIWSFLILKPNLTMNSHYHSVIEPLLTFTNIDAKTFYEKYHSTTIESSQNYVRNYLASKLLPYINDYKSTYLQYPDRMYSLDMKIQLLNALMTEGSYIKVLEQAVYKGRYLNHYDGSIPFIIDEKICYSGIFESNDQHRCLKVIKKNKLLGTRIN